MIQLTAAVPSTWRTVATFEHYEDARRAVDHLAHAKFPLTQVSIIGCELYLVEQVLGRITWARAAAAGVLSGAWIGLLVGLLLWIFAPAGHAASALLTVAAVAGAGFGAVLGLITHAIGGGRRDYVSRRQIIPRYFEVSAAAEVADHARALLTGSRR